MLDRMLLYDALFRLASGGGREEVLFGNSAPLAREAFRRSLIGEEMPLVWFELPMLGSPRFDLHVALAREALCPGVHFASGTGNGYDRLFRWYADEERGGVGLAFAYDVSDARIDRPAVHVNTNGTPLDDIDRFFDIVAGTGAAKWYHAFERSLPPGWRVWYAGVHPGRPGSPLRVDCFVSRETQSTYAGDVRLLERDLRACGFDAIGPALEQLAGLILRSPFGLELQFDLLRDGKLGPTIGLSAAFSARAASGVRSLFADGGAAACLMDEVEHLGLADGRWRQIADAAFTRLVSIEDAPTVLSCVPTFLKLRMRDGVSIDAKVYLQAGARNMPR